MKRNLTILIAVTIILGWSYQVYAWEGETHKALTEKGASNNNKSVLGGYIKNELGMTQGLGSILLLDESNTPDSERVLPEIPENPSILDLLKTGAHLEDVPNPRARHHFHDPYRNAGLDNKTEHPQKAEFADKVTRLLYKLSFDLTGASTLKRALGIEEPEWEQEYENYFAWPDARNYFNKALTEVSRDTREHYLALTFLALGHVSHLLEDMGVPPHARNDFIEAHFRVPKGLWGNPLESYVEDEVNESGIPARWFSGWTPQAKVFSKLSDYWDVDAYTGQYVGTSPLSTWGLSEQTNYQFLSKSTIFRENDGTKYYFPHPDVCNVTGYIEPDVYLWDSIPVHYRYFSGYDITHLGRTKYIYKYAYVAGIAYPSTTVVSHTTFDEYVYEDYAAVTIPRTIDYATGLVNYFFRGKLEIEPNCLDCNTVTFVIRNDSNNSGAPQVLKGGTFELYWDDRDGNRTEVGDFAVVGWTAGSELGYDEQVTGTFTRPDSNNIVRYTVVYKGAISENPAQPDEDDANAIAVGTLLAGYPIIAWGYDSSGQVSNVPEGNDFVDVAAGKYHGLAIRSDGSLVAWGSNSYGQCNVPGGNDFIAIAGGSRHSIALKSDGSIIGWGDNTNGQIDVPEGNDFVAIASGDYHNLAITTEGLIVGWGGWNDFGECNAPEPNVGTVYVAVSAGRYHSLALQSDGTIRAWGSDSMGQTTIYYGAEDDHEAVAAGGDYNFLLREDYMLITWGGGDWLEQGIPDYHYRQPDGHDFVAIAAGGYHIAALTIDGQIMSWGYDDFDPPPYPVPEGIVFTKDVAAGWKFTIALKSR